MVQAGGTPPGRPARCEKCPGRLGTARVDSAQPPQTSPNNRRKLAPNTFSTTAQEWPR